MSDYKNEIALKTESISSAVMSHPAEFSIKTDHDTDEM